MTMYCSIDISYIALQYNSGHYITLQYVVLFHIPRQSQYCIVLQYIAKKYTGVLLYNILHYIALAYSTLTDNQYCGNSLPLALYFIALHDLVLSFKL